MHVVYALEPLPTAVHSTIFLAGPTPRDKRTPSWRPEALRLLSASGYTGHVFVPEAADGEWTDNWAAQVAWEEAALHRADCIVFWVPRDMQTLPGLTTNIEWGAWYDSGKVIWGAPTGTPHVQYPAHYAQQAHAPVVDTLAAALTLAVERVKPGLSRILGEVEVPLHIWRQAEFQDWYTAHRVRGNTLESARVLWSFYPKSGLLFSYVLKVAVHVAAEARTKSNEWVFFRKDVSQVVLYASDDSGVLEDMRIALVREFRSPVRNGHAYVYELPGGSSFDARDAPLTVAAEEVKEETGLELEPGRLRFVAGRQLAATLSAHRSSLWACRLTAAEMDGLDADKAVHGNLADTERTYIEVQTVREIVKRELVDWTTLGMILTVLLAESYGP